MAEKRYYWLKLKDDFFTQLEMKKLRRIAGGDTYVIIVLELQLLSLKTGGILEFTGLEEDFAAELSLAIDEDIDNISFVLMYLKKIGWLVEETDNVYTLPNTIKNIGSETYAAKRMRKMRNNSVTMLQDNVTTLQECSIDIDIEKREDTETDKDNIPTISPKGDEPEDSFSESFNDFWKAYPKKVSKATALKAWSKLKPDNSLVMVILSALEKQKQSSQWQKDNGQFIPYPATWLNGKRWEDEQQEECNIESKDMRNSRLYEGLI